MPIQKVKGLEGLKGLYDISAEERESFFRNNADKLAKYKGRPMTYGTVAERIYNNQKLINQSLEKIKNGIAALIPH